MQFVRVTEKNIMDAGVVHAVSWRASHRDICSDDFIKQHTAQRQAAYLRSEMNAGKLIYMLVENEAIGVVSVCSNLIENLYVLPSHWRKGYGSALLEFAQAQCSDVPTLWVLSSNEPARRLYEKHGYICTGRRKQLTGKLYEFEMQKAAKA